jgi:hypothetical protein
LSELEGANVHLIGNTFSPAWHAVGREIELATQQIGSGIVALGNAAHARRGQYTAAFFGISTGLERIAKLIIIADHALDNNGSFPSDKQLRNIGHDLEKLLEYTEHIACRRFALSKNHIRPDTPIHQAIISVLSDFAKSTRYYNLNFLTGSAETDKADPMSAWWTNVANPIIERHYPTSKKECDVEEISRMGEMYDAASTVIMSDELGEQIGNFTNLMLRVPQTRVAQRYGRMYALQIVRWLAYVLCGLAEKAAGDPQMEPLFGLEEHLWLFIQPDSVLRDRKIWGVR